MLRTRRRPFSDLRCALLSIPNASLFAEAIHDSGRIAEVVLRG
jgi:hypothetical protein